MLCIKVLILYEFVGLKFEGSICYSILPYSEVYSLYDS